MTTRESSFRETSYPGKMTIRGNDFPGNVFPGKKPSGESNHPGNDCKPNLHIIVGHIKDNCYSVRAVGLCM